MEDHAIDQKLVPQISVEDAYELEKRFQAGGVDGCVKYLQEKQDDWKNVPLNIGIIGNSGAGKSSFINTIRGMDGDDDGAAAVGVTETTFIVTSYEHPKNPKLKFWDLPGVGTVNFPKDTYFEKIQFEQYDFFIVLSASRFTELDKWLAESITKEEKKLYFVRTKIGSDIDNDMKAHPKKHDIKNVIETIRKNVKDNLTQLNIEARYFLIDSYERERTDLDFDELEKYLIEDFPEIKRDALVMSLNAFSKAVVNKKVEILQKRIWKAATLSAAGAAVPVPGVSMMLDFGILYQEISYFYKQLGLDPETVKKTARLYSVDEDRVLTMIEKALPYYTMLQQGKVTLDAIQTVLVPLIHENVKALAAEEIARYIPLIGALIATPISYYTTSKVLNITLVNFQKVALQVVNLYIEKTIKET